MQKALVILFFSFIITLPFICLSRMPATTQAVDDTKEMEASWADLAKGDPWSSRALLDLYDRPARTVAFLKEHLKPLKIERKELDDLLDALGSEDEKIWKPAFEKLTYFDPRLSVDLQTLMANADDTVRRNHLIEVLCDTSPDAYKGKHITLRSTGNGTFNFVDNHTSWWAEKDIGHLDQSGWGGKRQWARADRAMVLLQHIGTPDAIAILKDMATGNPDAQPTKVAKVALESLEKAPHE